jgi:hypothetical protein
VYFVQFAYRDKVASVFVRFSCAASGNQIQKQLFTKVRNSFGVCLDDGGYFGGCSLLVSSGWSWTWHMLVLRTRETTNFNSLILAPQYFILLQLILLFTSDFARFSCAHRYQSLLKVSPLAFFKFVCC